MEVLQPSNVFSPRHISARWCPFACRLWPVQRLSNRSPTGHSIHVANLLSGWPSNVRKGTRRLESTIDVECVWLYKVLRVKTRSGSKSKMDIRENQDCSSFTFKGQQKVQQWNMNYKSWIFRRANLLSMVILSLIFFRLLPYYNTCEVINCLMMKGFCRGLKVIAEPKSIGASE